MNESNFTDYNPINLTDSVHADQDSDNDGGMAKLITNLFEFSSYLGLLGNLLIVIVLYRRPRLQPPDYFLMNLAIIDLLYASGRLFQFILEFFSTQYEYQSFTITCISLNLFYYFLIIPTLYTLALMTMERIVLVINVSYYRKMVTKWRILTSFLAIYSLSALTIIPNTLTLCLYDIQPVVITYLFQCHILLLACIVSILMISLCLVCYCRSLRYGTNTHRNPSSPQPTNMGDTAQTFGNISERMDSKSGRGSTTRNSYWSVWFVLLSRQSGMPRDMTNLSVVNNMHGRVVISPLRPDVIERQARMNSVASSSNSTTGAQNPQSTPAFNQGRVENAEKEKLVPINDSPRNQGLNQDKSNPNNGSSGSNPTNDRKTCYLLTAICGFFIFLYWPNIIATALYNLRLSHIISNNNHIWLFIVVNRMSLLHTLVNPITSLIISSRFRTELSEIWERCIPRRTVDISYWRDLRISSWKSNIRLIARFSDANTP